VTVPAASTPPRISDEQLPEFLALLKKSDSVELKLTVPESAHYSVAATLDLDPLEAQMRQVFFFDTPDLALNRSGVVVRARRVQRMGGDSVVKLRPVIPGELAEKVRAAEGFTTEVDAMPGAFVCSGTLKRSVDNGDVRQVVAGTAPLKGLFSKAQRSFLADHGPEGVGLEDLSVLGPILVLKLKFAPSDFDRRMVAELWSYPDGSRVLELSTKCAPKEAFQTAAEARAFLSERGVDLSAEQETKTAKALEFFAGQIKRGRRRVAAGGDC
jgi:hypothetical protein